MKDRILGEALTFDDVLLVPRPSSVVPSTVDVRSRASRRVALNVPILSAAMDTVTESALAIALAQQGGLGIVHKNLSVEAQCREVRLVKRSVNGVITDPVTLPPDAPIEKARELMEEQRISGIPIVSGDKVVGILTSRDLKFVEHSKTVREVMTTQIVTAPPGTNLEKARDLLHRAKVEKLLLVNSDGTLAGLITIKDIDMLARFPASNLDPEGRLRVGAAVGVADDARVAALAGGAGRPRRRRHRARALGQRADGGRALQEGPPDARHRGRQHRHGRGRARPDLRRCRRRQGGRGARQHLHDAHRRRRRRAPADRDRRRRRRGRAPRRAGDRRRRHPVLAATSSRRSRPARSA